MATLELNSLSKRFGGVQATDDVSLTLEEGKTIAMVGPNGAGKSTLIQIMTGFVAPDAGKITVDGTDITGASPEAINAHGIIRTFQTSRVFPLLSIFDSVMVGAQRELIAGPDQPRTSQVAREFVDVIFNTKSYRKRKRDLEDRAETILKMFDDRLWPRRDEPAFSLSYANRRRLEIARALMAEPRFLLLDEPAAGMNPTETVELTDLIQRLVVARPTLSILLVEHKLDVVRGLAQQVIVLNNGRVIARGDPTAALSEPVVIEAYLGTRTKPQRGSHV